MKLLDHMTPQQIREAMKVIGSDGHTIWKPEPLIETLGFPREFIARFTHNHKSGSGKAGITVGGKAVAELSGVHGLPLLEAVAENIEARAYPMKLGRGSRACEASKAIIEKLEALGA